MDTLLQQMYSDFTGKVLPMVADWLVLTKDYALELGARYIDFYIYTSIFGIVTWLFVCLWLYYVIKYSLKKIKEIKEDEGRRYYDNDSTGRQLLIWFCFCIMAWMGTMFLCSIYDIIKASTIPEIIIAEKIMDMKNGNHCSSCDL